MQQSNKALVNLDLVQIPLTLRKELKHFCEELVASCRDKMISITVIGSAAAGDFLSGLSDLNLLVVFSELELKQIDDIAAKARKWCNRSKISPRFISKRNLMSSLRYFPIDFWTMQKTRIVIYGEDILKNITIQKEDLLWQLRHEIKGLRMRLKQQFWRTGDDVGSAKSALVADFNTVVYLSKILLYLKGASVPDTKDRVIELTKKEFNTDIKPDKTAMFIKLRSIKLKKSDIIQLYEELLKYIRTIDDIARQMVV